MRRRLGLIFFMLIQWFFIGVQAQILDHSWGRLAKDTSEEWLTSKEATETAERVLLYQRDIGGWPKNIQPQRELSTEKRHELASEKANDYGATIDNSATTIEMTFLANLQQQQPHQKYLDAFHKGLEYILTSQYPSGGWPQFYPTERECYFRHITYNDDAMINVLRLLQKIEAKKPPFDNMEISEQTLTNVRNAIDKGVECIINTQYRQGNKLTAWCAQHDRNTLQPAKARSYELISLSGKESAQIVKFLMSLDNPSEEVIQAVKSAIYWFQDVKLEGIKEVRNYDDNGKLVEKTIVKDANAKPVWARFMDLETNVPFFCDRDGIRKSSYDQIGHERRNGYAWYTLEPQEALDQYKTWLHKVSKSKKKKKDLYTMVVSQDGNGDFTTIQDAIDHAKSFPYQRVTIHIKNGIYHEKILVPAWNPMVSLIGENRDSTIIRFGDFFDKIDRGRNSTFFTASLQVDGNDFYAANLTIENNAGAVGQAIALSIQADRAKLENCIIKGHQDTFYAAGEGNRVFIKDSEISGTTDFIFGEATVLFEGCEIKSLADSYITAASTPKDIIFGFVFMNCKITATDNVDEVYLGRPWRTFAKTVFLNCELGNHIIAGGWNNWGNEEAEKKSFYGEYNSSGPGANAKERVRWSHILTSQQAENYTKEKILKTPHLTQSKDWYNYEINQ